MIIFPCFPVLLNVGMAIKLVLVNEMGELVMCSFQNCFLSFTSTAVTGNILARGSPVSLVPEYRGYLSRATAAQDGPTARVSTKHLWLEATEMLESLQHDLGHPDGYRTELGAPLYNLKYPSLQQISR